MSGLIVDLFAGGGGASLGIELALGRDVDIAINHDAIALAVHKANHPRTRHLEADIWEVKPLEATQGRPVELLWASPDCTHFSSAKGDVPKSKGIRSLAWAVTRWAKAVRPRVICVENVGEFQGWGPLGKDGKPIAARKGETFRAWVRRLERLGYDVDWQVLDSSTFGAPTKRRRLFVIARCDGESIEWPAASHGKGLVPLRTAAECIDWSMRCPSIFERKRPLAKKTMWRIAEGIRRYVLDAARPFLIPVNHGGGHTRCESLDAALPTVTAARRSHALVSPVLSGVGGRAGQSASTGGSEPVGTITSKNDRALVVPTLIQTGYGERKGQTPRVPGLDKPLGTCVNGQKHALVTGFLAKFFGGEVGHAFDEQVPTITARDHNAIAAASLVKLRGTCIGSDVEDPVPTISAQGTHIAEVRAFLEAFCGAAPEPDMFQRGSDERRALGLVRIDGVDFQIVDIGLRMLEPHELLRAQFGEHAQSYDMSSARTKSAKVRLIGNSVVPHVSAAIVGANVRANVIRRARAEVAS